MLADRPQLGAFPARTGNPLLTVLVPARNAAALLPAWLASVSRFADRVMALDDGSTDDTRRVLESHPLVAEVLTNPVRATYHGWDDRENRQRLIYAALARGGSWLLFLDADETIEGPEGHALRCFLEREAQPGFAYGFEVLRTVEDEANFDPRALWVFRLFSASDAVEPLGSQRLHFVPVPRGIPRQRWLHTSIRIRHSGGLTQAHRAARLAKYHEADPHGEFQDDYATLIAEPSAVLPWRSRDPKLSVLLGSDGRFADQHERDEELTWPAMTAIVIAQDDEAVIERCVGALRRQRMADEFEIIVVCSGTDRTSERVRQRFPDVRCVQLPRRALPGEARNAGLWMARGEYISFPGSHIEVLPGSLQARLDAHEEGWDMVSGSVLNGNDTLAGWASYFLDHSTHTPSRTSAQLNDVPGSASYVTSHLRAGGGFPEDMRAGEDTVVNRRLFFEGKRTYFCPEISFIHASPSRTATTLLRHHFQRGRALGRILRSANPNVPRTWHLRSTIDLPQRRMRTINQFAPDFDEATMRQYEQVRRLVKIGAWAASAGTWAELALGARHETPPPGDVDDAEPDAPVLAIGGRCGEAPTGLLSAGSADAAVRHLQTLSAYAAAVRPVRRAFAPIVTSATVTSERNGTSTVHMDERTLDAYLRAARTVSAHVLLQLQPGHADLLDLLDHWSGWVAESDVGVMFDVRDVVAFAGQRAQLGTALAAVRAYGGDGTVVLARGAGATNAIIAEPVVFDLRRPGTPWPHEALGASTPPPALVYQ